MIFRSLTSTVTYIFSLYDFGEQIIPFKLGKLRKNSSKGKKDKAKSVHETHNSRMQIMTFKGTTRWTFWVDFV